MTRDYYPEFVVVVGGDPYDIETKVTFPVGLHEPEKHNREQAVELACRMLYEQGASSLLCSSTLEGIHITCEVVNRVGDVPKDLEAPAGFFLLDRKLQVNDTWTRTLHYTFIEDPDVFKKLYRSPGKKHGK